MISTYLKAVSIIAPGLPNWAEACQVFTHQQPYKSQKVAKKLTTLLPPNENRRSSRTTQIALSAVQQLFNEHPFDSQKVRYVFTSCNGDLTIFHQIATALTMPGRPVSPTKFHNSVHNAPAGYCAIALKAESPSTSITAYEDSFANGLLEAAVQSVSAQQDCLFCGYDEVPPEPMFSIVSIEDDFAYSLLLSPEADNAICRLDLTPTSKQVLTTMENPDFEQLRNSNPQAKILPLLYSLAQKQTETLYFANNQEQIAVHLSEFAS